MSVVVPAATLAAVIRFVRPFTGEVVHRQLPVQNPAGLWAPTSRARRWNRGFSALYTSLLLDVAFAERIKRSLARPASLVVGVARASIARVLDFQNKDVQRLLGFAAGALTTEDYALTQRFGAALFEANVTGLLVPAAIASTATRYPSFRLTREGHSETRVTPHAGTNLVIFTDNLHRGDGYPESHRVRCELTGIPA
ncbi:MAG TPA: RES family NAD+ phosphorylase [bacterium]|nr:RES family NAD+ phosphorylase [bacterium]